MAIQSFYPDVIGAVTGGPRINMDVLEVAIGIHPKQVFLNQPIEVVIALQSMVDKDLNLKIAVRTPNEDRDGSPVLIEFGKPQVNMTLKAGEVGVLRIPFIVHPPTKPAKGIPVRVAIRYRVRDTKVVRPAGGGSPPSVLSVSPFKLQVLRDIEFIAHKWNESTDILTCYFDLAPKHFPGNASPPPPRYEILWTQEAMQEEIKLARSQFPAASALAKPSPTGMLYLSLMDSVEEHFAKHSMPLHPGEIMAIAKIMAYTVEDAPQREPNIVLEETRWFRALCQLLASDPDLAHTDRNDLISHELFESVIYEAILLAFNILRHNIKENLGSRDEQLNYANRFMKWIAGHGEADLSYVYLPLVLGGVSVARLVRGAFVENPWDLHDQLDEAIQGRLALDVTGPEVEVIFNLLDDLLETYRRKLRSQRIPHPSEL